MSYRHPALRELALACVVYDDLPILVCKDSEYFAQNEEIYENFWEISEKVPIFAARKEDDSSRWNERVAP